MDDIRFESPVELPEIGSTWVYFVEMGQDGPIKIGFSKDPEGRRSKLQTGAPEKMTILCCLESDRVLETALHRQLCRYKISGEWFQREGVLRWLRTVVPDFQGSNSLIF